LTRNFALCGTPDNELTEKIISEEVSETESEFRELLNNFLSPFFSGAKLHQVAESYEEA
jgi:hypothetical protein